MIEEVQEVLVWHLLYKEGVEGFGDEEPEI